MLTEPATPPVPGDDGGAAPGGSAAPGDGLGLGRTGRRVVAGIVVAALLLLAGAVVVVLRWEQIKAWADAPAALDAQRAAMTVELPAGIQDDPTLGACDLIDTLRCGWTTASPRDAVVAVAEALEAAGLDVDDVACDEAGVQRPMTGGTLPCGAPARLSGATMWVLATDRTPEGGVPFGRTSVWIAWDSLGISTSLAERLWADLPMLGTRPLTLDEARALLPQRFADAVGTGCAADQPGCLAWEAPLDATDLGDDPAATLVRELAEAGLFPAKAGNGPHATVAFASGRTTAADGELLGLFVAVRHGPDGGLMVTITSL